MAKKVSKNKPVEDLEQQVGELTADVQRIQADFANYKRRADHDRALAAGFGKAAVVAALLPIVDNIERAVANTPKDLKGHDYVKGVESIAKQLSKTLDDLGVSKIQALNKPFDADLMDAVQMEDKGGAKEIVVEELQPGYKIGERVIRHAKVRVERR
jgi:molecular chaperone GrpE